MFNNKKSQSSSFQRLFDIGLNQRFSITEIKYLRVTNIAATLGAFFMFVWMIIALFLTNTHIVYGSNGFMALVFLFTLVFNYKGWRVLASVWLIVSSFISVLLFLYLLGYSSGVAIICILLIIMPYMTFPQKARKLAHAFSISAFLVLISSVFLQSELEAKYNVMDSFLLQMVNISITGLISLILVWSLSVLIDKSEASLILEQKKSDDLLHNILPANVVKDLKETGKTIPKRHNNVSILFTDFKGFTELVASIPAITLVKELNDIFGRFDEIVGEVGIEKIQTIGDAYVAACGPEEEVTDHASRCIKAAQIMLSYLEDRNSVNEIQWKMRVGIHSGPIVAGVVGKKKFSYDLFGDTINTASRMETSGEPGKINISGSTFDLAKDHFEFDFRGKIHAKGKGELEMYFVK